MEDAPATEATSEPTCHKRTQAQFEAHCRKKYDHPRTEAQRVYGRNGPLLEQIKSLLPLVPLEDTTKMLIELQDRVDKNSLTSAALATYADSMRTTVSSLAQMGLGPTTPVVSGIQQLVVTLGRCLPATIFDDVCMLDGRMCVVAVEGPKWTTFSCHAGCVNDKARKAELKGTNCYSLEEKSPASVESHVVSFDDYEQIMTKNGCGLSKEELADKYEVNHSIMRMASWKFVAGRNI